MNYFRSSEFQKFISSFAGPKATSPIGAIAILSLLSIGSTFTDSVEAPNQINILIVDILLAILISFLYFILLGGFINKFLPEISLLRISLLIFLFFTTEVLRTLYIAIQAYQQGLLSEVDWNYRIIAGGLTGLLFFGVLGIILNDRSNYKVEFARSIKLQKQLKQTSEVTEQDLIENKNKIINTIRSAVNQALQAVLNEKINHKENVKVVVDELVRVSDQIVRPLSHELFENKFEFPKLNDEPSRNNLFSNRLLKLATYREPFHPLAIFTIGLVQLVGIAIFAGDDPLQGIWAALQFLTFTFLIMAIAKRYLKPQLLKMAIIFRIILISFVYTSLSVFLIARPDISSALNIPPSINFYVVGIVLISCWVLAFYSGLQFARLETLNSLAKLNEELSWSAARLGAKLWNEQKKLASIVHKDIQGALIASALKFRKDIEDGKNAEDAIRQIRTLVEGTEELVNSNPDQIDLKREIQKLNELWEGIFCLSLDVDDETYQRIQKDLICEESVNNFIGEFATNSVKHGKATKANVQIKMNGKNKLSLIFENNGEPLKLGRTAGLGTKMAQQQSLSVEYSNLPSGGVSFKAILPIS